MKPKERDQQLSYIRDKVRKAGVRWTMPREAIVKQFIEFDGHHSVEAFYEVIRKSDSSISMATVYRTFNLLVEIEVAVRRSFDGGPATFEYVLYRDHHDHLIDVDTGEIIEFVDEEIEILQKMVARKLGFSLHDHRLVLYGKAINR